MSATMKKKTGVTAVWGTTDAGVTATAYGIVKAVGKKNSTEKEFFFDDQGETVGEVFFDAKKEYAIDILCKSSMTEPTEGGSLTIGAYTCIIQDSEVKWEQRGLKMMTVNATKFVYSLE